MDGLIRTVGRCYCLLLILGALCFQSRAETSSSMIFIDSPTHQYLRSRSSDGIAGAASDSISTEEIGAAVSVLLGLTPPATLSATSSSKLNEVLMPNPFDRPRHVLLLEVALAEGSQVTFSPDSIRSSRGMISKMIQSPEKVQIELPYEDEVAFSSLDGPDFDAYEKVTDREISDFASWLGGSYVANELKFLLPSGVEMKLHLSKVSDKEFASSLISLVRKIRRAVEIPGGLSKSRNVAGLVKSYFNGIKTLQESGSKGISQQGTELFLMALSRIIETAEPEFRDQVVIVIFKDAVSAQPEVLLDVTSGRMPYARFLEEAKILPNSTKVMEVALVRKTLAWVTGIVLIIATLMGVCMLMNMPITRDTLLYSNVKLD